MTLFFHAGTAKTGSSSLQVCLRRNQSRLMDEGLVYPSLMGRKNHTALSAYSMRSTAKASIQSRFGLSDVASYRTFWKEIEEEFDSLFDPDFSYIISNEGWGKAFPREEILRLKALLSRSGQDIKVIMYFRDPIDYLAADYTMVLRHGFTHEMVEPTPQILEEKYNYLRICDVWSDVFGRENVFARPFLRKSMLRGSTIYDFLDFLGVAAGVVDSFKRPHERYKRGFNHVTAGIMRAFNEGSLFRNGEDPGVSIKQAIEACDSMPASEGMLVPEHLRDFMYESLKEDLSLFNEKYLFGEATWPFPPYKTAGKQPVRPPNDAEVDAFLSILNAQKAAEGA